MSCVYKLTFPNGGVYIGETDMEPESRWENGWGYRNIPNLFNAIVKYGWVNVKREILYDNIPHEDAIILEKELIENAWNKYELVYNVQHIPAQYMTTSDMRLHAQQRAQGDVENTSCFNNWNRTITHHYLKEYIVPLTTKPDWMRTCPIDVYDLSGNYITTYPSAKITAEELGVNQGNVVSCCKGVRSTGKPQYQSNGYVFRYAPEKIKELV